jgi:DNA mismatch endonuclease, patch repair protein
MSRIRGRGNLSTERRLIALFREHGIAGWRRHQTFLRPGGGLRYIRPDFVFRDARLVVMVDGCFWHGCPKCFRHPKSNRKYWGPKLRANIARDGIATNVLKGAGWQVVRIWEHQMRANDAAQHRRLVNILNRIERILR